MTCDDCPFYKSGYAWNLCELTNAEYFRQRYDCNLVNDDGTVNDQNMLEEFGF